jgi:2-polyprenyl-3-methyl-5-hydroxy-6-metoxy-1,4-benzoquinol methylase
MFDRDKNQGSVSVPEAALTNNAIPCPLCKGQRFGPHHNRLLTCNQCQLVVNPSIYRTGFESSIEEEWFGEDYVIETSFWDRAFQKLNNSRTYHRLYQVGIFSGSFLEVGIGNGSLLSFMQKKGFQVEGCDVSASLAQKVQQQLAIPVYDKGLASIPISKKYDVIVANHVLEHNSAPLEFLQKIKQRMHERSVLHLAVPNIDSLGAKLTGWVSYQPYHLIYFNKKTLTMALEKVGIEIETIVSHESFSGWPIAILRSLNSVFKNNPNFFNQSSVTRKKSSSPRRSLIRNLLQCLLALIGVVAYPIRWGQARLGKGDELIVIGKMTQP